MRFRNLGSKTNFRCLSSKFSWLLILCLKSKINSKALINKIHLERKGKYYLFPSKIINENLRLTFVLLVRPKLTITEHTRIIYDLDFKFITV